MSISFRHYLFLDDGSIRRVPQRILEALPFGADAIPEFAGTRQRAAHVILELKDAKPFRILDARGAYWEFDAEGRVDEHMQRALADRIELMATPRQKGPVVDLVPEIKLRERIDRNTWTLTAEDLDRVAADLWPSTSARRWSGGRKSGSRSIDKLARPLAATKFHDGRRFQKKPPSTEGASFAQSLDEPSSARPRFSEVRSMSRMPLQTVASAPADAKLRLEAGEKANGFLPNLLALLANAPAALEAYLTLGNINAKASLSLAEREVVQITAAATHGCGFCVAGHTKLALNKAGLPDAEVEALRQLAPVTDRKLAAVQTFTQAVIRSRGAVEDGELEAFKQAGYDDASALEVVLGIGLATICNFANNLGQPELNPQLEPYRWQPSRAQAAE